MTHLKLVPPRQKKRASLELTEEEARYFLNLLTENVTEYDCGSLCAPDYGGVPYCCTAGHAVPLLYRGEFAALEKMGNLWHPWKPTSAEDRELKKTAGRGQVFCECTGVQNCVREQRSISCRSFPLEPYLDRRGVFVGLTYLQDFTEADPDTGKIKCPLTLRPGEIRQEFIDQSFSFWEKLMLRLPDELETYRESSVSIRRSAARTKKKPVVFLPSHYANMKGIRDFLM